MAERDDLCGRIVGDFVLRDRIGQGGFGAVYRCEQPLLGREAVVKVLHHRLRDRENVVQRFMREAQLASRLDHPYAAHIYAFGVEDDDGLCWIAMEMVYGVTLGRWLRDRGRLAVEQMLPFFERVAEVVQTAHEYGIVHRDLKPSNIMVIERAGQVLPKLLDFGIAKLVDEAAYPARLTPLPMEEETPTVTDGSLAGSTPDPTPRESQPEAKTPSIRESWPTQEPLTEVNARIGSPPYMAPEQWLHPTRVGPRADLYALAVVAYELLTGRRPFHARSTEAIWDLQCNSPVPPLGDGVPVALDAVFARALSKVPEDRPASALELAAVIRNAAGPRDGAVDFPRLDESIRDAWIAHAPQPLAEAVAVLDGARNAHQARDAAMDLFRGLVRYLVALALASRAQVRDGRDTPALGDLLRDLKRRELDDGERVQLLRLLVAPFASRRGAHPLPELVDLVAPPDDGSRDELDVLLDGEVTGDRAATEELVRSKLTHVLPQLGRLLRNASFILDHPVVIPTRGVTEQWTGLRRQRRVAATVRGDLVEGRAWLIDRAGRPAVALSPLVQAIAPTLGADPELFVFDGPGRHGARLTAAPAGFEHHDPTLWGWLAEQVVGDRGGDASTSDDERPPYLGLSSFSSEDADRFVGREREIDELTNRLRRQPLQIVIGPSGAGKSSFVHAGVVPSLPPGWRVVTMRPGIAPLATLEARLTVARATGDGVILVVIDQLEELFTLCRDPAERHRFASVVAALVATADAPTRVIATVRDDFLMQVEALEPLRGAVSPSLFLLGNPSREDLARTIIEPARRVGYELSDAELARDMVEAVADRPGALALLSFTAGRLWELRDRQFHQLTRNAYDALGGVGGALRQHAEATFTSLAGDEQRLAQMIFRELVTSEQTRAVLSLDELKQRLASERASAVIDKLLTARLLSAADVDGEMRIEIVHEALLVAWPRLSEWRREDAEGKRLREQLQSAAKQWSERGRVGGLLWRDDALLELLRWRARHAVPLTDVEEAFAGASVADGRRNRRRRSMLLGGSVVALLAIVAGLVVFSARIASQRSQLRDNMRNELEDRGRQLILVGDPLPALAYLEQAGKLGAAGPSHDFLMAEALRATDGEIREVRHGLEVRTAELSRDGMRLLTAGADDTAIVWDIGSGRRLAELHHRGRVFTATFAPNDATVLTASFDGTAALWDASTGEQVQSWRHSGGVRCARYSPDGAAVLTAGDDDAVVLWDVAAGTANLRLQGAGVTPLTCGFSPDGTVLAAGDRHGVMRLWDRRTGRLRHELAGDRAPVYSLAFTPKGDRILVANVDGNAVEWDVATGAPVQRLALGGFVSVAEFSPDGESIITATQAEHTAVVRNARTGDKVRTLGGHTAAVRAARYSPDGRYIVTTSEDASAQLWDARTGRRLARWLGHGDAVTAASFDARGDRVVTAGADGRAIVWRAEPQDHVVWLNGHAGAVQEASFSSNGERVVTASSDGTARIWDATSGTIVQNFDLHVEVTSVALSPDGRWLATGGANGSVALWDAATGAARSTWVGGTREVAQVSWSPDGTLVVAANVDGWIRCWDASSGGLRFENRGHDGHPAISAVFDPAGTKILTTGQESDVRVWDVTGKQLATYGALSHALNASFDPTGTRVVGIARQAATIWDARSGVREVELIGHLGLMMSAAWSSDGSQVITSAADGTARIWDAHTGEELARFLTSGRARTAHFSPSGDRIVIGDDDGSVAVYALPRMRMTAAELRHLLRCRVPFEVRNDRLEPREREACE